MDHFIDSLYTKFLLRDLLAKVVPGLLLLLGIFGFFTRLIAGVVISLSVFNVFVALILVYGVSFIISMAIQFLGERTGLIQIYVWPKGNNKSSQEISLEKYREILLLENLPISVLRQRERFTILKEMTGNFAISFALLSISMPFLGISFRSGVALSLICIFPITAALAIVLFKQNHHHAEEQYLWEKGIIENTK